MNSKIKAIAKRIKEYDPIVIARHIGPDPDAIASQIALRDAIKLRYPSKRVYAVGNPVSKFKYFGKLDKIDDLDTKEGLLFVLDCPNISRIDGASINDFKETIKIDHHPFEDKMGQIEWVDTSSSSTCELITEFLISARYRANKTIAENLYLGVVADSDRFLFKTTSYKTLELMSILVKNSGINVYDIYPKLYLRPLNEVQFQSYITEHLNVTENGFASLQIEKNIIDKYGVDSGTASNLVNNFNNIEEIICWALVSYDEKLELYKVNIRSRGPVINEIASRYNGGGHAMASGARIKNIEDIHSLFNDLDKACKEYNKEHGSLPKVKNIPKLVEKEQPLIKEPKKIVPRTEKKVESVKESKSKKKTKKNTKAKKKSTTKKKK